MFALFSNIMNLLLSITVALAAKQIKWDYLNQISNNS